MAYNPPITDEECRTVYAVVSSLTKEGFRIGGKPSAFREAARRSGTLDECQIRHRFRKAEKKEGPVEPAAEAPPKFTGLGGDPKDREIIRLKDEVSHLKKELVKAHREVLSDEAVRDLIGGLSDAPVNAPSWMVKPFTKKAAQTPQVPVTMWADWHAAEKVSLDQVNGVNEYNLDIMEERVRNLVARTINLAKEHGPGVYPGIVVNLVGDFVSGRLHPELVKTDEEGVLPAALRVRDLLVWALTRMADEFGSVYAPAVCGNHGRNTPRPEYKDYIYDNFDWLIYQMLIRAFEDMGDKRIVIDVQAGNEVSYKVYNQRYLLMHGDMMGVRGGDGIIGAIGPIMRGEVKVRGWAASSRTPYDMLVIGHWHQPLHLPRCIVSNTLKGYCEFAKNALRAPITPPSQPLWFVHPRYNITSRWEVMVGEFAETAPVEWVSVPAGGE